MSPQDPAVADANALAAIHKAMVKAADMHGVVVRNPTALLRDAGLYDNPNRDDVANTRIFQQRYIPVLLALRYIEEVESKKRSPKTYRITGAPFVRKTVTSYFRDNPVQ